MEIMKNLEQIKNRLENENGLDCLLAEIVGVEDYYTEEYNNKVGDGVSFDLIFNFDTDNFEKCNLNEGELFEQSYNCVVVGRCEDVKTEEELIHVVEYFLEISKYE